MINTKNIKIAMIEKEISIVKLSKKLNVSINTLSRWLNGHNLNQIENFLNLLIYLDISIDDIKKS